MNLNVTSLNHKKIYMIPIGNKSVESSSETDLFDFQDEINYK